MQKTIRHWWKKSKMTQHMVIYIMFLDWKNQYCENHYIIQSNLQIQGNTYQTINSIFHRIRTKFSQFSWKHKRPQIAKAILTKKKWSWRNQPSWLQTVVQSYSHQESMVLAQKQKCRPMGWERRPRDKLIYTYGGFIFDKLTKESRIYNGEKIASSISGAGKTGQLHAKTETRTLPNTLPKNKLKWIKDWSVMSDSIKLLEENTSSMFSS